MKNLPTLRNDSSFAVQFSISVSKTRAILLFKIKIKLIEMFELNERMPGMRSAEYQATIPLKFFIIIHNYVNVQTINQSKSLPGFRVVVTSLHSINGWSIQLLLRGENDSRLSDEIQATSRYVLRKPKGVQKVDSYTYIPYKCNHLKHTPLFLCMMFHCYLLQVPVVQKVGNAIQYTKTVDSVFHAL